MTGPTTGGRRRRGAAARQLSGGGRDARAYGPAGEGGAELRRWASIAFPERDWGPAEHHHGAFHDVLVLPSEVALRVPTGADGAVRAAREVEVVRAAQQVQLGVAVPEALSGVVHRDGASGYLVGAVPGAPAPPAAWTGLKDAFAELLAGLASAPGLQGLPPVRAWCGGERFPDVVARDLVPLLDEHAAAATQAVSALLDLPAPRRVGLVHGDFGAHNLLWSGGRASALIDWDHACSGDPAADVAPLVGAHGASAVAEIVDDEVLHRAMVHRATLPLQVAAAAHLAERWALRDHALGTFRRRSEEGTLSDPGGGGPVGS